MNKILDPIGLTPPMMWESQEPESPKPPREPTEFHWSFLYTEILITFLFVGIISYIFRKKR